MNWATVVGSIMIPPLIAALARLRDSQCVRPSQKEIETVGALWKIMTLTT